MFVRDIAEFKISIPSSSLAHPRTAPGPKHLQVFSSGTAERMGQGGGTIAPHFWGPKQNLIKNRVQAENGKYLLIYDLPPPPLLNLLRRPFSLKCTTALWTGKENVI